MPGISTTALPVEPSACRTQRWWEPPLDGGVPLSGSVLPVEWNNPVSGYNYCGPGQGPGDYPAPTNDTDSCCKFHDRCYGTSFSGKDVVKNLVVGGEKPRQLICDRVLCECLSRTPSAGSKDFLVQQGAMLLFCH
jgi:hypothetical protein